MQCPCDLFDLNKYKDKPYLLTPCSKCSLVKDTHRINKHILLYDTDGAIDLILCAVLLILLDLFVPLNTPLSVINAITKACLHNLLVTLSNTVLKLCLLSKDYPALFQVLTIKMQHPLMSYYLIGQSMVPPCSKQNVLYHLLHAVRLFPLLAKAIITDTRFSGGKNAIKKVLDKVSLIKLILRIQHLLYKLSLINTSKSISLLQLIFKKPYKSTSITYFN